MERQVITLTKLTRIEDRRREVIEEVTLYRALTKADASSCLIVALPRLNLAGAVHGLKHDGYRRQVVLERAGMCACSLQMGTIGPSAAEA
jgi:hypothetical protein